MALKKSIRPKKSAGVYKWSRLTQLLNNSPNGVTVVAVMCVMAAAMLIAAYESPQPADRAGMESHPQQASQAGVVTVASREPVGENPPVSATKAGGQVSGPVTISGCLERDDATFRLKDTSGENAPKGRTWKSGFLKKSSTSVELVDAGNRLRLPSHVGQRVTVTGTLVDREMRVRSLRRIAPSCASSSRAKA